MDLQIHLSFVAIYACIWEYVSQYEPSASTPRKYAASCQRECVRGAGREVNRGEGLPCTLIAPQ
jgi:hypothetical protein